MDLLGHAGGHAQDDAPLGWPPHPDGRVCAPHQGLVERDVKDGSSGLTGTALGAGNSAEIDGRAFEKPWTGARHGSRLLSLFDDMPVIVGRDEFARLRGVGEFDARHPAGAVWVLVHEVRGVLERVVDLDDLAG